MELESSKYNKMTLEGGFAHQFVLGNTVYEQLFPTNERGWMIGNSHKHPFAEYYIPTMNCDARLLYLDTGILKVKKLPHSKATCVKDIPHQIILRNSLMHLLINATEAFLKNATVPLDYSLYENAKRERLHL